LMHMPKKGKTTKREDFRAKVGDNQRSAKSTTKRSPSPTRKPIQKEKAPPKRKNRGGRKPKRVGGAGKGIVRLRGWGDRPHKEDW